MKLETTRAAEAKLLVPTYDRNPLLFERGEGVFLIDEKGDRYLDLLSGIGVNALGYGHKSIEDAIARQSKALIHTSNLYFHTGQAELALRLTEKSGMDRVFFANTGTEAWEGAMKFARAHAGLLREEGRTIGTKFLAMEQSFHGRTYGSVSTTYKAKYREPFGPTLPGVEFVRFNDVADLKAKFSTDVCAILIEAIQGEGGIRPATAEFMQAARELTQATGALLIVDEIQAGVGRTGKFCAYQHYDVQPDITTLAKPLAGGVIAASTVGGAGATSAEAAQPARTSPARTQPAAAQDFVVLPMAVPQIWWHPRDGCATSRASAAMAWADQGPGIRVSVQPRRR